MPIQMEFNCKLAHSAETKKLSNFNSQKELFERISQGFSVPMEEILYCTINTHNFRNMDSLLGHYLSSTDLIVVHLAGESKDISIEKTQECLGLTITDNGFGRAFVKKVVSEDPKILELIRPGDHIAAINSDSMIDLRHYEVARTIRSIKLNTTFTMKLIEPKYSLDFYRLNNNDLDEHGNSKKNSATREIYCHSMTPNSLDLSCGDDLINSSLPIDRLLSKNNNTEQEEKSANKPSTAFDSSSSSSYRLTIDKMNSILESFLGINDNLLAIRIYRLAHENQDSFDQFSEALKESELSVFNFDNDLQDHLWKCASKLSSAPSFQ